MSTTTFSPQSEGFSVIPRESARQSIRHYTNLAATIALVLAIAAGGWLAMSQLPSGNGEGKFAFLGQTDGATCDIESMTVDEVMSVVENPYPHYFEGDSPDNEPMNVKYWERDSRRFATLPKHSPNEEQFASASEVANTWLPCLLFGSPGQQWALMNPFDIQTRILNEFPVYRDEATIRSWVEQRLSQPSDIIFGSITETFVQDADISTIAINPDRELASFQTLSNSYPLANSLTIGLEMRNSDGEVVVLSNANGSLMVRPDPAFGFPGVTTVTLVQTEYSDRWYIAYPDDLSWT